MLPEVLEPLLGGVGPLAALSGPGFLDNREVSRATVDARLAEVERIAKDAGVSIAIGQAFPVTLERIRAWAATLEGKGIALVPISAVVDKQSDR